jgi:hypothetical protein
MNYQELIAMVGANSFEAENCKVLITLEVVGGKPALQIDLITRTFEDYDKIQQDLLERDVEFLERSPKPLSATVTHFQIPANLNLIFTYPND